MQIVPALVTDIVTFSMLLKRKSALRRITLELPHVVKHDVMLVHLAAAVLVTFPVGL
jgi:hypothetical protein